MAKKFFLCDCVKAGCSDTTCMVKLTLFFGIFALGFDVFAMASPHWLIKTVGTNKFYLLLWQSCSLAEGQSANCVPLPADTSTATRVGQITSSAGLLLGLLTVILMIFLNIVCLQSKKLRIIGLLTAFGAASLIVAGVVVIVTSEAAKVYDIGSSVISAVVGAILFLNAGMLLVVDVIKNHSLEKEFGKYTKISGKTVQMSKRFPNVYDKDTPPEPEPRKNFLS